MRGKDVAPTVKLVILLDLAGKSSDGKLKAGAIKQVAQRHSVSASLVASLWKSHCSMILLAVARPSLNHAALLNELQPKRNEKCGRKPRQAHEIQTLVSELEFEKRETYRCAAYNTCIPKSSLHRYMGQGILKNSSNSIKPRLTEEHKKNR
ncbi:hypothetical protein AeNC1_010154, partial [Aphanomyces euteiches]